MATQNFPPGRSSQTSEELQQDIFEQLSFVLAQLGGEGVGLFVGVGVGVTVGFGVGALVG